MADKEPENKTPEVKLDKHGKPKKPVKQDEINGGVSMELVTTQNPDGDIFIPFFTSYRSLQQFAKRYVDCYKINCLRLFDLIQSVSAVLNPNAYGKEFTDEELVRWLTSYCKRLFSQQFKRSCLMDGPAVEAFTVSPRVGFLIPSDAENTLFLKDLESLTQD